MSESPLSKPPTSQRKRLLRYTAWLASLNALLLIAIGQLYWLNSGWPEGLLAQVYQIATYTMHFAALAYLPWLLVIAPLCLLLPWPRLIRPLALLLLAVSCSVLLIDALLYHERQFHLNALTVQLLGWHTWVFAGIYLLLFSCGGLMLGQRLWLWCQRPAAATKRNLGQWPAFAFFTSLLLSQGIHVWADANYYSPVTRISYHLPVYYPLTAKRVLTRYGLVDLAQSRKNSQIALQGGKDALSYPQTPLQCEGQEQPLNVLLILVDALRADMLSEQYTPSMLEFAQNSSRFTQHYSGGNSSRMGVFSLFYGLPANYWQVFQARQQSPVMVDELQRQSYAFGIFTSSKLYRPASLDRTAFAKIPDLRMETQSETPYGWDRDQVISAEWQDWLNTHRQNNPQQPFFGFLYYDSPTSKSYPSRLQPIVDKLKRGGMDDSQARYHASVNHVDSQIREVLEHLKTNQLLDNTVVLLTADHGTEFDDSQLGYHGYGNAYTRYQLQVPFLLHWPGEQAQEFSHRTSHTDWVVTVMDKLLGCKNRSDDYASGGKSVYRDKSWSWLIAGSYHDIAVVSPSHTIISSPSGGMEVRDSDYQLLHKPQLDADMISEALFETTRFFMGH